MTSQQQIPTTPTQPIIPCNFLPQAYSYPTQRLKVVRDQQQNIEYITLEHPFSDLAWQQEQDAFNPKSREEYQWDIKLVCFDDTYNAVAKWLTSVCQHEQQEFDFDTLGPIKRISNTQSVTVTLRITVVGELKLKAYYMPLISYGLALWQREFPAMLHDIQYLQPKCLPGWSGML